MADQSENRQPEEQPKDKPSTSITCKSQEEHKSRDRDTEESGREKLKRHREEIGWVVIPDTEESGRERLKRLRREIGCVVIIPDTWGKEESMMRDSMGVSLELLDRSLVTEGIVMARKALAAGK